MRKKGVLSKEGCSVKRRVCCQKQVCAEYLCLEKIVFLLGSSYYTTLHKYKTGY